LPKKLICTKKTKKTKKNKIANLKHTNSKQEPWHKLKNIADRGKKRASKELQTYKTKDNELRHNMTPSQRTRLEME